MKKTTLLRNLLLVFFLIGFSSWGRADEYMVDEYEILSDLSALNEDDTYVILGYRSQDLVGSEAAAKEGYVKREVLPDTNFDYDNMSFRVVRNSSSSGHPQEFRLVSVAGKENVFMLRFLDEDKALYTTKDKSLLIKGSPDATKTAFQWSIGMSNNSPTLYIKSEETSKYIMKISVDGFTATKYSTSASYYVGVLCRKKPRTVSIGASGYMAYVTTYATDFSQTQGLTAYKVTAFSARGASMVPVTKMPAETGVVLKASQGNYTICEARSAVGPLQDNLLLHGEGITGAGTPKYVVANKAGSGVGFYRVAATDDIPEGTPYLQMPAGNDPKDFYGFIFRGDAVPTSVKAIPGEDRTSEPWFNLQGQAVSRPTRGIFVRQGKKTIKLRTEN